MSRRVHALHKAPMLAHNITIKHKVVIIPEEGPSGPGKKSAVLSLEFEEPEIIIVEQVVEQPLGIIDRVKVFMSEVKQAILDYIHEKD